MSQELSDEQIDAIAAQCKYDFHATMIDHRAMARAVIAADRAKRVPMTNAQIDQAAAAAQAASWGDAYADFEDGVRAAEAFHGIGSKT